MEYWKGSWVCDLLGESGLGFVIQDHTDHGASEERSFSSSDQLPWHQARNCRARQRNRALNLKMKTIILKVLNHSSVFQILEVIFGCQELQSAVWNACFPGLPHGDLLLTYRCKFWLQYGYLGTLNACDQWPIDLILQNRVHFVFIAKFVERLPTIFPVNIWRTHLFEIEHRWAKWLISDPSPKGTRWINDPSSLVQSGFDKSLIWKWICSKGTPQISNPDPDSLKGTHLEWNLSRSGSRTNHKRTEKNKVWKSDDKSVLSDRYLSTFRPLIMSVHETLD